MSLFHKLISFLQVAVTRVGEIPDGIFISDGKVILKEIKKERNVREVNCDFCGTPITKSDDIGLVFLMSGKYRITCEKFHCREDGVNNFRWNRINGARGGTRDEPS